MPYQLEQFPDAPIMIFTMRQDYNMATDAPAFAQEIAALAPSWPEPVFLIMVEDGYRPGLQDIMVGASVAARGENPVFHNPGIREVLYVTPDKMGQLALKGLNSPIFGHTMVKVFDTREEALAYARSSLGHSEPGASGNDNTA